MKPSVRILAAICLLVGLLPVPAGAQQIPGFDLVWGERFKNDANHWEIFGGSSHLAEMWQGTTKFHADKIDYYEDTRRIVATGHVQLTQPGAVISADRMEFNTQTGTGTFYKAWGMVSLGDRADKVFFGGMEPDLYFEGETVEKIGASSYKITRGRFTTCVQPVRRWEITAGTVIIHVDHYAMLRNPVIRVKGVPVFYVPILYFPTKKDDRATGILMPTYGMSTVRGFTLSNAFFWAIDRSQDLTIMHDWFSRTGQGVGSEYRYVRTPASQGSFQAYMLNESAYEQPQADGTVSLQPAKRSYQVRGSANEQLTSHLRAGGRIAYFTDVVSQQTYNTNILDASRSQRTINGSLAGSWGITTIRGSFDRSDYFTSTTESAMVGSTPRVSVSRSERPIGRLPIYFGVGGEYVHLQRGNLSQGVVSSDGLSRIDVLPTVRIPFTSLRFLTANSTVSWRGTFWTRSWNADRVLLDQSISRRLFELQSNISGPVLNRVFDTPGSGYAEKLKHTIEPFLNLRYTSAVDDFDRIVQWESVDAIVGGVTQATYGLNNRLYAKRKQAGGVAVPREILSLGISQTYYTDARASQYDQQYGVAFTGVKPYNFSPIALTMRTAPADGVNATLRAEIDARYKMLRTLSAGGNYSIADWLNTTAAWNLTRYIDEDGRSDPASLNHFISGAANFRLANNRYGGNYSLNYDIHQRRFVQQRFTAYYNAQCCGFAVDYQTFNFGTLPGLRVPQDNRLNFSVTLAGIGSFSNFFGALAGTTR